MKMDLETLEEEYGKTVEILEQLENLSQDSEGTLFQRLKESIEAKQHLNNDAIQRIKDVEDFFKEAKQFEYDIKKAREQNNIGSEEIEEIAYDEETAIEDVLRAAKSAEKFVELKEESARRSRSADGKITTRYWKDKQLIYDVIAANMVYYFWEGWSALGFGATVLRNNTDQNIFEKELKEIEELNESEAVETLKSESENLKNDGFIGRQGFNRQAYVKIRLDAAKKIRQGISDAL